MIHFFMWAVPQAAYSTWQNIFEYDQSISIGGLPAVKSNPLTQLYQQSVVLTRLLFQTKFPHCPFPGEEEEELDHFEKRCSK